MKLASDDVMNKVFQQNEANSWREICSELREVLNITDDELNSKKFRPLFEKIECWAWHEHQLRNELDNHEPKGIFWNSEVKE